MIAGLHIRGLPAGNVRRKNSLAATCGFPADPFYVMPILPPAVYQWRGGNPAIIGCMDVQVPSAPAARRPVLQSARDTSPPPDRSYDVSPRHCVKSAHRSARDFPVALPVN
eukprot:386396_1